MAVCKLDFFDGNRIMNIGEKKMERKEKCKYCLKRLKISQMTKILENLKTKYICINCAKKILKEIDKKWKK